MLLCVDEKELDIPNGENNAENEEEQDQPEVEEQEYYVEGSHFESRRFRQFFANACCVYFCCMSRYQLYIETSWRKCLR